MNNSKNLPNISHELFQKASFTLLFMRVLGVKQRIAAVFISIVHSLVSLLRRQYLTGDPLYRLVPVQFCATLKHVCLGTRLPIILRLPLIIV